MWTVGEGGEERDRSILHASFRTENSTPHHLLLLHPPPPPQRLSLFGAAAISPNKSSCRQKRLQREAASENRAITDSLPIRRSHAAVSPPLLPLDVCCRRAKLKKASAQRIEGRNVKPAAK